MTDRDRGIWTAMFLALYVVGAGCAVTSAALIGGMGPAFLAASPFCLVLCVLVGIGIARNG